MAKKKRSAEKKTFVLFNVAYEDGTLSSNRKVPSAALGGFEGDEAARAVIEAQDDDIAKMSGKPRSTIETITRSPGQ